MEDRWRTEKVDRSEIKVLERAGQDERLNQRVTTLVDIRKERPHPITERQLRKGCYKGYVYRLHLQFVVCCNHSAIWFAPQSCISAYMQSTYVQ